jgi:SAM-dependent methyltransferase
VPERPPAADDPFPAWVDALQRRHRETLTFAEVRKGLQALSSLYVERRQKIAGGAALEGNGKRAAFALYYGPAHFLLVRAIVRALDAASAPVRTIADLGCGTGAAGAAWALETGAAVEGVDRSGWAVEEAQWTLARLRVRGRAKKGDVATAVLPAPPGAIVSAFTVNELEESARSRLLVALRDANTRGVRVLIVEPLARRPDLVGRVGRVFAAAGGRQDEWRFEAALPKRGRARARGGARPATLGGGRLRAGPVARWERRAALTRLARDPAPRRAPRRGCARSSRTAARPRSGGH